MLLTIFLGVLFILFFLGVIILSVSALMYPDCESIEGFWIVTCFITVCLGIAMGQNLYALDKQNNTQIEKKK